MFHIPETGVADDPRVWSENKKTEKIKNRSCQELLTHRLTIHCTNTKVEANGIGQYKTDNNQGEINDQNDPSGDQAIGVVI